MAPTVSKVALTRVPPSAAVPRIASNENAFEAGVKALGLQVQTWRIQSPDDIDKAFAAILKEGIGALYETNVPVTWINRRQIWILLLNTVPAIYLHRPYVVDGGLMAYAEDEREGP